MKLKVRTPDVFILVTAEGVTTPVPHRDEEHANELRDELFEDEGIVSKVVKVPGQVITLDLPDCDVESLDRHELVAG